MTLQEQARLIVEELEYVGLESNDALDNKGTLPAQYIEQELQKAYRAGQAAALERKGIQPRLDIEQEVSTR